MADNITAAILRNGKWILEPVERGLEAKQRLVGGYIQVVPIECDACWLLCNEDGIALGLKPTAVWMDPERGIMEPLLGPIAAFGPLDSDGYATEATEATIEALHHHIIPVLRTMTVQVAP